MKNPIQDRHPVTEFLGDYDSDQTRRNYRMAILNFFQSVYGKSSYEQLDAQALKYLTERNIDTIEQDLKGFVDSIKGFAPKTVKMKTSALRIFLIENDVELSEKFWRKFRKLRRRKIGSSTRALTLDRTPTTEELKQILTHMPIQGKALYLLLSSSGMRIGEALQLRLEDIDLSRTPMRIEISAEYTKTKSPRIAFASRETKETIQEWLKVRDRYLKTACDRSSFPKRREDDRVFPFEKNTAYLQWSIALRKASTEQNNLGARDRNTNILKLHPHVLRKFFRTKLGGVIPIDVVEALMGHEGYLTEAYRRYSEQDLAEFYLKGEDTLSVFTEPQNQARIKALERKLEERENETQELRRVVESQKQNGITKTDDIEKLNKKFEELLEYTMKLSQAVLDREAVKKLPKISTEPISET